VRIERIGSVRLLIPTTRRERRRGLLGLARIGPHDALLLERCRVVHTVGMRCAIDVVILDRERQPVDVITLRPGRIIRPRRRGRHVLETAAGRGLAIAQVIQAEPPPQPPNTHLSSRRSST